MFMAEKGKLIDMEMEMEMEMDMEMDMETEMETVMEMECMEMKTMLRT